MANILSDDHRKFKLKCDMLSSYHISLVKRLIFYTKVKKIRCHKKKDIVRSNMTEISKRRIVSTQLRYFWTSFW